MTSTTKAQKVAFIAESGDVVIAIMGRTGVGKSTFLNCLSGSSVVEVGHDLESCTQLPTPVIFPRASLRFTLQNSLPEHVQRLVILDTPGFDDTYVGNPQNVARIVNWLRTSYGENARLGGIVYLHDISQSRIMASQVQILSMFSFLSSHRAVGAILLATTRFKDNAALNPHELKRENDLVTKFWEGVIPAGTQTARFCNNPDSAWDLIEILLRDEGVLNLTPIIEAPRSAKAGKKSSKTAKTDLSGWLRWLSCRG